MFNIIIGISYLTEHWAFDKKEYRTPLRCYVYVGTLFFLSTTNSLNWLASSISFIVSNMIVTIYIRNYFESIPSEYYIIVISTIACFSLSLYCTESDQRKVYNMYTNMMDLKKKQSTILNLFPECLVITNIK